MSLTSTITLISASQFTKCRQILRLHVALSIRDDHAWEGQRCPSCGGNVTETATLIIDPGMDWAMICWNSK